MNKLNQQRLIESATFWGLVLSIFLMVLAAMNMYDYTIDKKPIIPHLACFISSFTGTIFFLLFWFLFQKGEFEHDYSLLFFALAMMVWGLPVRVFYVDYFHLQNDNARQIEDARSFLNSMLLFCAWYDLEFKCLHWLPNIKWLTRQRFYATVSLVGLLVITLFFSGLATSETGWFPWFDCGVSILLLSLLAMAVIYGFYKRMGGWLGLTTGIVVSTGFLIAIAYYIQLYLFKVEEGILTVLINAYQFLILISVSILVVMWTYEKINKRLDRQRQDLKHFTENLLSRMKTNFEAKHLQSPEDESSRYAFAFVENFYENYKLTRVFMDNQPVELGKRMEESVDRICKIYGCPVAEKSIKTGGIDNIAPVNAQKIIGAVNELAINACKYGNGPIAVFIEEQQEVLVIRVTNNENDIPPDSLHKKKKGGLKMILGYLTDIDPAATCQIDGKSISFTINRHLIK